MGEINMLYSMKCCEYRKFMQKSFEQLSENHAELERLNGTQKELQKELQDFIKEHMLLLSENRYRQSLLLDDIKNIQDSQRAYRAIYEEELQRR